MIEIYFEKTRPDMKMQDKKKLSEDLLQFLAQLACYLHASRKRDFVTVDVGGSDFMEQMWNEVLKPDIERGKFSLIIVLNDKYRFSHLSFQEYFVASTWADNKKDSEIRQFESKWLGLGKPQLQVRINYVCARA